MTEQNNFTETFVTGQNIAVRLLIEVGTGLLPIIINWDSAEISTKFKGKKNHGIGVQFTRNQNTIEDYEITLTRAKQDSAIEAALTTLQRNQSGMMYHPEFVIEIEINHCYYENQQQPPSNELDEFAQFVQKAGKNLIKQATRTARTELTNLANGTFNSAKQAASNILSKSAGELKKEMVNQAKRIIPKRDATNLVNKTEALITPTINAGIKFGETKVKDIVNSAVNLVEALNPFSIKQPEVFKEVYQYIFAVINDGKVGHQPKDISKESVTFNASKKLVKTEKDILHSYTNTATIKALTQSQINQTYAEKQNYGGSDIKATEIRTTVANPSGSGTTTFITQDDSANSMRIKTNQNVAKTLGTTLSSNFDDDFAQTKALMNQIFDYKAPGVK